MRLIGKFVVLVALLWAGPAFAQCTGQFVGNSICGNPTGGLAPPEATTAPVIGSNLTVLGEILSAASTTSSAGLNIAPGAAPSAPNNGDVWTTSGGLFSRINGTTYDLLSACANCAVTNATNTFTAYQILNFNAAAAQTPQTGVGLQFEQIDSQLGRFEIDTHGGVANYSGVRTDGTGASPTTLQSGDQIVGFNAFGCCAGGTTYAGPQAGLRFYANQNWSSGALGTYADIAATPNASSTLTEVAYFGFVSGTTTQAVGIGTSAPTAPLTITTQTATLPTPVTGTQLHLIGANSTNANIQWNTYNTASNFYFERADGSLGSESALSSGDVIGGLAWRGYGNGSAYSTNQAVINAKAVGAWTSSNLGTVITFNTTPQNSTTQSVAMSIYAGVVIGSSTTDPGAGNLAVGGSVISPTLTGTVNINGISGAGAASKYVCVDSSGNMLTQSGAC